MTGARIQMGNWEFVTLNRSIQLNDNDWQESLHFSKGTGLGLVHDFIKTVNGE